VTSSIRVALLDADGGEHARELGAALGGAALIRAAGIEAAERLLRGRGFVPGLTRVPATLAALAGTDLDVAHAFTPLDAVAALAWRRRTASPVVFTCVEPLGRENMADRRLRLWSLRRALEDSDALLAADAGVRASMERWAAIDAPVIDPSDAAAHERLYRDLLLRRG
jgi:hypothetical protein